MQDMYPLLSKVSWEKIRLASNEDIEFHFLACFHQVREDECSEPHLLVRDSVIRNISQTIGWTSMEDGLVVVEVGVME